MTVHYKTRSFVQQRVDTMSNESCKDAYGACSTDLGAKPVWGTVPSSGATSTGVVVEKVNGGSKLALVLQAETDIVDTIPLMTQSGHLFEVPGPLTFLRPSVKYLQFLGLKSAARYQHLRRRFSPYTREQMDKLAAAFAAKRGTSDDFPPTSMSQFGNTRLTPIKAKSSRDLQPSVAAYIGSQSGASNGMMLALADVGMADTMDSYGADSSPRIEPNRRNSQCSRFHVRPPTICFEDGVTVYTPALHTEDRGKPPSYCMKLRLPDAIFAGFDFGRQLGWARSCVHRQGADAEAAGHVLRRIEKKGCNPHPTFMQLYSRTSLLSGALSSPSSSIALRTGSPS